MGQLTSKKFKVLLVILVFFSLDVKTTTFLSSSVCGDSTSIHFYSYLYILLSATLPDILCCSVKSYYGQLQYGHWVFAAFNLRFLKKTGQGGKCLQTCSDQIAAGLLLLIAENQEESVICRYFKMQGHHSDRKCVNIFLPLLYRE